MENDLNSARLCAESIYRKLVAIQFDLKHGEAQEAAIQLSDIQIMFDELKQKLSDLNIRTNFPAIQYQYNDAFDTIKMIEELMLHIENILFVLKTLQTKDIDEEKEKQSELLSATLAWARDTLWKVRVVESKLHAIVNVNPSRWGNHTIATYIEIKELFSITEDLALYLKKLEKSLKNLNINETLVFSLDIPSEYTKNYLMFLIVPSSLSDSVFMEKLEQIKTLRKRIEQIIEKLKQKS